ncbi:MAG TPA: amino acid adenylation domain-containing protein, partial [Pseudonocardiaceae bacterium]
VARPDGTVEALRPAADEPAPEPPRAATAEELAVAAVWADVLGRPVDSIDADFYDLGGHSMLAVRLVARLRPLTAGRRQVGVMDVVAHRTVRRLTAYMQDTGEDTRPEGLLHELTPPTPDPVRTLVCVPYGGGSAVVYQALADALPPRHRLLSVAIPGHDVGLDERLLPFDTLVEECVAEIRERVTGPLVLYGHCGVGGALAVAIARRLQAAGRDVEALYLGGLFPTARARGPVARALRRLDLVASNKVYANWLTGMGVDLGELEPAQADRIVANMRRDGRAAEDFFTALLAEPGPPLRAPVVAVVGERDRVTEFHEERHREWHVVSDTTAVAVIAEAGHYFLAHRADELADLVTRTHPVLRQGGDRAEGDGWRLAGVSRSGAAPPRRSLRPYLAVASGQLVSLTGSALVQWAIPVWIYLRTGSLVSFALFAALGIVPTLLVSPVAGVLVDRLDRRRVMLVACASAGLAELALGGLLWAGRLQVWHLYVLVVCLSTAAAFQRVAFFAATPQLVPKQYLGHANGVNQLANGFANLVVPLLAAGALAVMGLGGILLIDIASFAAAIAVLAVVRFPRALGRTREEPLADELLGGLRLVWRARGLRALLLFFAVLNVFLGAALIMVAPLVLSFGTLAQVGQVAFAEGLGAAAGGLLMILWGGPARRRMAGVLAGTAVMAACYLLVGLRPSLPLIAAGLLGAGLGLSLTQGIYATIVQVKVPQRFHGRVFALNQLIAWSTLPLGYAVVGPLGSWLLEPLLLPGGALASTVGAVLGVGPGRGIGLLYLVLAVAMLALTTGALRVRALATFDATVPDAPPDDLLGVRALAAAAVEPLPVVRLEELVARQARLRPSAVALVQGAERVRYGELWARVTALAEVLRGRGVRRGDLVAVAVDRSVPLVVAVLAVLRCGAAYVPLDLGQPTARLRTVLGNAEPVLLLVSGAVPAGLPPVPPCPVLDVATVAGAGAALSGAASSESQASAGSAVPVAGESAVSVAPDGGAGSGDAAAGALGDLAYVVHTSGSTGVPKGVLAHHRGVVNHLRFLVREHGITPADTVLQIPSPAFDAAVRDLFGGLAAGARVVLLTPEQAKDPAAMLGLVRRHRVTCLLAVVPTLLRGLVESATGGAPTVRLVLFAGERLHADDCAAARGLFGADVRLVNQYGPTECTMTTTFHAVEPGAAVPDPVPLGRAVDGTWARVLDARLRPLPPDAIGEVYLGGAGVAHGYLNAPSLTAQRFVADPFEPGARMYRTGDLGLLRPDGVLEFHGRADDQVKIRGQRVEPGDVEAALRRVAGVRDAAVLALGEPASLTAFLTADGGTDPAAVRAALRAELPDHMVPAELVVLDVLPRTPNGKLDRRALAR